MCKWWSGQCVYCRSYIVLCCSFYQPIKSLWHHWLWHFMSEIIGNGLSRPSNFLFCFVLFKYLSDPKQCAHFKASSSRFLNVINGAPQGSMLGPALLTIYVNGVGQKSKCIGPFSFKPHTDHQKLRLKLGLFEKQIMFLFYHKENTCCHFLTPPRLWGYNWLLDSVMGHWDL